MTGGQLSRHSLIWIDVDAFLGSPAIGHSRSNPKAALSADALELSAVVRTWPARSASIGGCDLRHAAVVAQKGGTNTGCENKPHASSIRRVQERKSAKFPLGWRRRRTTGKGFSKHPVVPQVQVPESLGGAWQAYYRCGTDLSIAVGSLRS